MAHLIDARGVSQAQLAREAGLPRSVVTNVLKGRRGVSQANIIRLARYFHVSSAAFMEGGTEFFERKDPAGRGAGRMAPAVCATGSASASMATSVRRHASSLLNWRSNLTKPLRCLRCAGLTSTRNGT